MFQGSFNSVSKMLEYSRMLKESVKCFQENFKNVMRRFQEYFDEVLLFNFVVAWIPSQLPKQKVGLLIYV